MGNADFKEALLLLEQLDDYADEETIEEVTDCNELLAEAYLMGATSKKELKAYVLNAQYSSSHNPSKNSAQREHRMRCNVCGHIFCYTDADIRKNDGNTLLSGLSAIGSLAAVLGGGTRLDAYALQNNANRYSDKEIDFNRCPHCNSANIEPYMEESNIPQVATQSVGTSSADEIKKFKELLDLGIITQEEFDAKKRQLLGL